jgi:glycosyltransferase involved in cell wall biosynthesis
MGMKNILIDATGIVNTPTGLGKYSHYLLKSLLKHKTYNFTIFYQKTLKTSHPFFQLKNKHTIFFPVDIPPIGPKREYGIFKIRNVVNKHDLFHCLSSFLPAFGLHIPSIVTIHDLKYLFYPEFFNNRLKRWYYKWIILKSIRKASHIIAVSQATKHDIESQEASSEKIHVIYEAPTILFKTEGQLPEVLYDKKYLLFVGENRPHKNIQRIINAYELVKSDMKDACPLLVFAGSRYEPFMKDPGNNNIVFLGTVDEQMLVSLYENALALVYPSLYEGFGLPIIEAMKLGLPVITSNCSSMQEIADKAAVLVDPYDTAQLTSAMLRITRDKGARMRLKKLGYERANEFSWEKAAKETCGLYEKILS